VRACCACCAVLRLAAVLLSFLLLDLNMWLRSSIAQQPKMGQGKIGVWLCLLASSSTLQKTERITILKCCDTAKLESLLHARIWWGTQFGGGDGAGGRRCRIRQCISAGGDSDTQGSSLGYEGCWGFVSSGCRGGRGGEGIGDGWWCDEAPLPRVDGGLVPAVAAASKC
jgi:hypothetical protein